MPPPPFPLPTCLSVPSAWFPPAVSSTSQTNNITGKSANLLLLLLGCRWAVSNGVTTLLQPALFDGGVRGLAATTDLPAGSEAVVVPQAALISHETAKSSDLVHSSLNTVLIAVTASYK